LSRCSSHAITAAVVGTMAHVAASTIASVFDCEVFGFNSPALCSTAPNSLNSYYYGLGSCSKQSYKVPSPLPLIPVLYDN